MILFVGNEEKGYFAKKVAEKKGWKIAYISSRTDIRNQVQDILQVQDVEYIIYDMMQYGSSADTIAEVITRIYKANNAKVIIHAEGYNPGMLLIRRLVYSGFENFVFASMLADKQDELEHCIEGSNHKLTEDVGEVTEEEAAETSTARTIGVAGAIARMGTTTQAIQFVKYLNFKGYRACYIQMNNHKWVEDLAEAYEDVECDSEMGRVSYKSVDMFYKLDKIKDVLKLNYDFYIYDYGVYSDWDFNKISFLEKEVQAFVVGTKPGEFMKTYEVIENNFYNNVFYIFNFIPNVQSEREDTYDLMQEKKDVTFFAPDCRDPFVFAADGADIYEQILPVASVGPEEKPKKKGLFRLKRKH